MGKKIAAVLAGTLCAFLTVMLLELAKHQIWPPPKALDFNDKVAVAAFMASVTTAAFLALLAIWTIAMFAGVLIATKIAELPPQWPALCVAVLFGLATSMNFVLLPHPVWLMIAAAISLPLAALAALRIGASKTTLPH